MHIFIVLRKLGGIGRWNWIGRGAAASFLEIKANAKQEEVDKF